MARNEQSIVTDQDNALILSDDFVPEEHDGISAWRRSSATAAACGYTYCKGDVMATSRQWRQPLRVWKRYFQDWMANPTPEKLLHSSIFFDLDSIYGEDLFVETLQDLIAQPPSRRCS